MRKRFHRYCLIAMAAVLGAGFVPAALAGAIYTTLGPGGAFNTNSFVQFSVQSPPGAYADEFTIPVSAEVGSVSLALAAPIPVGGSTVDVSIRTNLALGQPGNLGSFTAQVIPEQAGVYTFASPTGIHLNAGTEYWLVASAPAGPVDWFFNDQGIDNITASRDLGAWTVRGSGPALAFSVNSVPEPGSVGLCAVSVVAAWFWRKRRGVKKRGVGKFQIPSSKLHPSPQSFDATRRSSGNQAPIPAWNAVAKDEAAASVQCPLERGIFWCLQTREY